MKLFNSPIVFTVLLLGILAGCAKVNSFAASSNTSNEDILNSPEFNQSIESYTDEFLTEIIRINNFNRERVKKVFCVAHPIYVETIPNTNGRAFEAYAKLLCVEGDRTIVTSGSMVNLQGLETKLTIQQYPNQNRFKIIGQETPRSDAFAVEDRKRIFR
jgi:hypothetical protein